MAQSVDFRNTKTPINVSLDEQEDTARYTGLLLALAEGFGLGPRHFLHRAKKYFIMLFWPVFRDQKNPKKCKTF